jgi:DNA alkylation repair enzyme
MGSIACQRLKRDLKSVADPELAKNLAWFFKTGKGEYGHGDRFLGIPVPLQRKIALRYRTLPLNDIAHLLASRIHEHRLAALEIWSRSTKLAPKRGVKRSSISFYGIWLASTTGISSILRRRISPASI